MRASKDQRVTVALSALQAFKGKLGLGCMAPRVTSAHRAELVLPGPLEWENLGFPALKVLRGHLVNEGYPGKAFLDQRVTEGSMGQEELVVYKAVASKETREILDY